MNLKNIILKSVATTMAISIVFGNISVCGVGISKAIAENSNTPDINIELQNAKYVQYEEETNTGVAILSKLSIYSNQTKEIYLPTQSVELGVNLPSLNGYLPEKAIVAEGKTKATTGEEINSRINQNYDSNSGLLTIFYENIPNDEGQIYSDFKENVKDEFEIIYIYPAQAYTGNEEEVKLAYAVNAKMTFKTQAGNVTSQNSKNIELTEKENKGDILTFGVTELEEKIYKGFLYSNVANKTNYDTEYKTVSTLCVLNKQVVNELTMKLKASEFVLNDKDATKISSNGKIVYKATRISKYEFDKILGQEGYIEFYLGEEVIAKASYVEVDKNGTKKLAVIYLEGTTSILNDEDTSIVVEYPENLDNLEIKVSKPVEEGFIHFKNQNIIKASENYGVNIEKIKYISTDGVVNEVLNNTKIELKEPETKILVTSSNANFSTLQTGKTTITVKLDDTNASAKLFDNPTITVKLPEGLTGGNLSSPEIVNGNGLKIKKATAKGNVITIELEGKQTAYDLNNVSGGVSIVMDFENIDFNDTLPTHSDKIEVTCVQGTNKATASCDVNIVSKYGLLMLSKTTGYNSNENITTNMDSNVKEINIGDNEEAKEVVQTLTLVNNYGADLDNMQIIGRIGYTNGDISSTFDTNLTKPITVNKEGVKIYYSENKDASYNDNSWKEEFTTNAKAYKVILKDSKLSKMDTATIKLYVQIPEKLGYNQETYLRTEANYIYNNLNISDSSTIKMATDVNQLSKYKVTAQQKFTGNNGENIPVSISIIPNITESYVHSKQLVNYKIRIENNSNKDLNNLVLKDIIPENAIYTYKEEKENTVANYLELVENPNIKLREWDIEKLEAGEIKEYEIMLTMADVSEEQKIINTIELEYNEQSISAQSNLSLKPAIIKVRLTTNSEDMIGVVYGANGTVEYHVTVTNVTDNKLENVKVQYSIPENLTYIEGGLGIYDEFEGYSIDKQGSLNNGIFEYSIDKLNANAEKVIVIRCKVLRLQNTYKADIDSIVNVLAEGDNYQSNVRTINTAQAGYTIALSSNIEKDKVLKAGDTITYTVQIKNVGEDSGIFKVVDNVPAEIKVNKIEYGKEGKDPNTIVTSKQDIEITESLEKNETLIIKITGQVRELETENETVLEVNNVATIMLSDYQISSNNILLKIKPELKQDEKDVEDVDDLDDLNKGTDNNNSNNNNNNSDNNNNNQDNNQDNNNNNQEQNKVYTLSGIAWLDTNKNGQRDTDEKLQDSVIVSLVNKETGNFALDANGNRIKTVTDTNGKYTFENLPEGKYIVLFEFDTNTYTVTTYQKTGIKENLNSDAILSTVIIDGNKKLVAITDNILLNSNKENMDIGLITNAIFDLSLNKQITKITVSNSQGTEVTEYEDGDTAKIDLVAKYMNTAKVIVNYKFTITNEGDVTGYVNSLVDSLPSGLEFTSELNTNWYKGSDGKLYTTSLSGTAIKPGESIEIELVLTKNMTEENTGTFPNNAKLEKISNLENIAEKDTALENNESSAILIISIKTGSAILYIGITMLSIAILAIGAYIIKKKVLNRGI